MDKIESNVHVVIFYVRLSDLDGRMRITLKFLSRKEKRVKRLFVLF